MWGILGYGTGELTLEVDATGRWTTGTSMKMAEAGPRGVLVPGLCQVNRIYSENLDKLSMAALCKFNGLASWGNAENSLQSVNLAMLLLGVGA